MSDETHETAPGRITWHSSDEGSGPDVGRSIGLGDGWSLWFGEITRARFDDAGEEAAALGDEFGTWIILYGPTEADTKVIGKAVDGYVGEGVLAAIARAVGAREVAHG